MVRFEAVFIACELSSLYSIFFPLHNLIWQFKHEMVTTRQTHIYYRDNVFVSVVRILQYFPYLEFIWNKPLPETFFPIYYLNVTLRLQLHSSTTHELSAFGTLLCSPSARRLAFPGCAPSDEGMKPSCDSVHSVQVPSSKKKCFGCTYQCFDSQQEWTSSRPLRAAEPAFCVFTARDGWLWPPFLFW